MTPVDKFPGLSKSARKALTEVGIFTLEDAAMQTDDFLLSLIGFGEFSLHKLREWQQAQPAQVDEDEREVDAFLSQLQDAQTTRERYDLARELLVATVANRGRSVPMYAEDAWVTASRLIELHEASQEPVQ